MNNSGEKTNLVKDIQHFRPKAVLAPLRPCMLFPFPYSYLRLIEEGTFPTQLADSIVENSCNLSLPPFLLFSPKEEEVMRLRTAHQLLDLLFQGTGPWSWGHGSCVECSFASLDQPARHWGTGASHLREAAFCLLSAPASQGAWKWLCASSVQVGHQRSALWLQAQDEVSCSGHRSFRGHRLLFQSLIVPWLCSPYGELHLG